MEGDAGTSRLNSSDAESRAAAASIDRDTGTDAQDAGRRPSRLGRGTAAALVGLLLVVTAGLGVVGYLENRANDSAAVLSSNDEAALAAAKDCVAATQAPDTAAMTASQSKILECSTGDFGVQAGLYASVLVDAYQAANVTVQVADIRAAVERHNGDGSMDLLVAVRVKVANAEVEDREQGYRLRVRMSPDDGKYKISRLDQVTS